MAESAESRHFVGYSRNEIIRTLIVGALVGIIVWGLTWLLNKGVFSPLMCHATIANTCSQTSAYAAIAAQIIAAIFGLITLVRQRVFRPLLVVLAASITLWGVVSDVHNTVWYAALVACVITYALAYAAFMLLARIRMLLLSLVAIVVLFVITRLVLTS
ncbi:MAG TPA: hypothetical protein VFQ70_03655 [Candidatus Saccharimonadaceae bacterium]|nr:hypothetical protein [Candidatus Saccharimonadaceae bacterium]